MKQNLPKNQALPKANSAFLFWLIPVLFSVQLKAQQVFVDTTFPGANNTVYDVATDSLLNRVYLVGSFTALNTSPITYGVDIDTTTKSPNPLFPRPNGSVRAVVPDGIGGWYMGGDFTQVGGMPRGRLAHVDGSGQLTPFFGDPSDGFDGSVKALALHGDKLFVGGNFTQASIGRPNGGWFDTITGGLLQYYPEVNGPVFRSCSDKQNGWFITGTFSQVGGLPRMNLAQVSPYGNVTAFNVSIDGQITWMDVHNDTLFIVGNLITVGGVPRTKAAAIHIPSGTVLPFNPVLSQGNFASVMAYGNKLYLIGTFSFSGSSTIHSLAIYNLNNFMLLPHNLTFSNTVSHITAAGGSVFLGGQFLSVNSLPRRRVARIDTTNFSLSSWTADADGYIQTILGSDSSLYIAGNLDSVNGIYTGQLAQINIYTSVVNPIAVTLNSNKWITNIALVGKKIYIAGNFETVNDQPRIKFAVFDAHTLTLSNLTIGVNNNITTMTGNSFVLFIGGNFTSIGGKKRSSLASIKLNTGQVTNWSAPVFGEVRALEPWGGDILVGGDFYRVKNTLRNHFAVLDTALGPVKPLNLQLDGPVNDLLVQGTTLYLAGGFSNIYGNTQAKMATRVNLTNGNIIPLGNSLATNGQGKALAINNNRLFLGGSFSLVGRNGLVSYDLVSGTLLTDFIGVGGAGFYEVNALSISGNKLMVGGNFTTLTGVPCSNLSALNLTTLTPDTAWNLPVNNTVRCLAHQDTRLFTGGDFTSIPLATQNNKLAVLDGTTANALSWWPPAISGTPRAAVAHNKLLFVGGIFNNLGGQSRQNLGAIDSAGNVTAFNATTDGWVNSMLAYHDTLFIIGDFTSVNGTPRQNFAAIRISTSALLPLAVSGNSNASYLISDMAVDNNRLYLAGPFTSINGSARYGVVAFSLITGALLPWNPGLVAGTPFGIGAKGGTVYVGGNGIAASGQSASNLQAYSASTAGPVTNPFSVNGIIRYLDVYKDELLVGGVFTTANGSNHQKALIYNLNTGFYDWPTYLPNALTYIKLARLNNHVFTGGSFTLVHQSQKENFTAYEICYGQAPELVSHDTTICLNSTISLFSKSLIPQQYEWFENVCGGAPVFIGDTFHVSPAATTTYFMRETSSCGKYFGCDSIVVNLAYPDTSITRISPNILQANAHGASYQWLDCDNGFSPISGATQQTFTAAALGNYAVQVSYFGCTDTSTCVAVTSFGLPDIVKPKFVIFPNPANHILGVQVASVHQQMRFIISDVMGKKIKEGDLETGENEININHLKSGVYFFTVFGTSGMAQTKFVVFQ